MSMNRCGHSAVYKISIGLIICGSNDWHSMPELARKHELVDHEACAVLNASWTPFLSWMSNSPALRTHLALTVLAHVTTCPSW